MKPIEEITCLIVDAGTFIPLADMMGRRVKRCLYYSPWEQEYVGIERCCIGDGMKHFERCDDFMDPDVLKTVDLALFPDIGFGGLQRYFRSIGKLVWGSMGASDLELFRTRFLKVLQKVGLPMTGAKVIHGVTALAEHLKTVEDKWVKINRYRDNMETWHHQDYDHSARELERLASVFGPLKERVVFVVQDPIKGDDDSPVLEVGYDGWTVGGEFPESSFQGYEAKNQLYLGAELKLEHLPEEVALVNEKMAPLLREYGYRNFWATEVRIKDGVPYFIDPTARMAGQTMEHLLNTCTNLPEVILHGAAGEIIKPEFSSPFAAEATMHYKPANGDCGWKTFRVPEEIEDYVKLYRCCYADGAYHFPPHKCDELGVICGEGDSVKAAVEDLKANFEALKDEPVSIELSGFADLINQIEDAGDEGVRFSESNAPLPPPEIALKD